jgi:hypothetical protein
MPQHKRLLGLPLIGICVCGAFLFSSFNTQSQDKPKKTSSQAEEVDTSKFPVADLLAPQPTDPKERAKRQAKAKRYNNKDAPKIEFFESIHRVNHTLSNLPALPIEKSSAIILGEVKDAKAYLSEDETTVYSEFVVAVQTVLKNDPRREITTNELVDVERYGGRVRLPSGKIILATIDHQDMPRVGARYVLFLTGDQDVGFTILAGYELRGGKVFPLDQASPTHPMARYKGLDDSTLLNDLFSVLANSPASSRLN